MEDLHDERAHANLIRVWTCLVSLQTAAQSCASSAPSDACAQHLRTITSSACAFSCSFVLKKLMINGGMRLTQCHGNAIVPWRWPPRTGRSAAPGVDRRLRKLGIAAEGDEDLYEDAIE